ncbi:MAG: DUF547 domain-containing protein [Pseudomonadota bacterium]
MRAVQRVNDRRAVLASLLCAVALTLAGGAAHAAPEPWALWDAENAASTEVVDHSAWSRWLDRFLVPGDDGINRVRYRAIDAAGQDELDDYVADLAAIDPRRLNRDEQFAYWANLYNAVTVQVVLKYPNKKSILRMGEKLFKIGPWDDAAVSVAGESLTLNDIEHRILRPIFKDERVHYAVNCASIGCPNLRMAPFTGAQLEAQLAAAERDYLSHERGVMLSRKGLRLSKIFKWYREDFASTETELIEYLAARHPSLGEALSAFDGRVRYEYDWNLNIAE